MTRIIAGFAKGRRLEVPHSGTRPTSDRAREGLFNTLASRIRLDGARVLDLFSGTGAVGLEALSRGAATAVLVESNAKAVEIIRRNVAAVGLPGAEVVHAPVDRYESDEPFDVVFADPPYDLDVVQLSDSLRPLSEGGLAPGAIVVVERSARDEPLDLGISALTPMSQKRYGEALLWYFSAR